MTSAVHEDQEAIVMHDLHATITFRGTIPRFGREQSPVPGWVQAVYRLTPHARLQSATLVDRRRILWVAGCWYAQAVIELGPAQPLSTLQVSLPGCHWCGSLGVRRCRCNESLCQPCATQFLRSCRNCVNAHGPMAAPDAWPAEEQQYVDLLVQLSGMRLHHGSRVFNRSHVTEFA